MSTPKVTSSLICIQKHNTDTAMPLKEAAAAVDVAPASVESYSSESKNETNDSKKEAAVGQDEELAKKDKAEVRFIGSRLRKKSFLLTDSTSLIIVRNFLFLFKDV